MTENRKKAFEMFAAGESVNRVANALFNKNWAMAKKMRAEYDAHAGAQPAADGVAGGSGDTDATGAGEVYDLVVKLPAAQIPAAFAAFSEGEQAYAVQSVLQMRMEAGG